LHRFIAGFLVPVTQEPLPLAVRPRGSLLLQPRTAVALGEAPDGLPLILKVERRATVEEAVLAALGYPQRESLAPAVAAALAQLQEAVAEQARTGGVEQHDGQAVYCSAATVGVLLGEPLLCRILGAYSPLLLAEDLYTASAQPDSVPITAAVAAASGPGAILSYLRTPRHLALPLERGAPQVLQGAAVDEITAQAPPARERRELVLEDLLGLSSARFHADAGGRAVEGSLADERAYAVAVRDSAQLAWSVSRAEAGAAVAQLARHLQPLHAAERVHCDLKPANTLLTRGGAVTIDAVVTAAGDVSPAASPGWAAPEQVLARPVCPATDVYALGLMATRLVGGALHGEERSYVVPTGGAERRRMRLLGRPEVFLDPTHLAMGEPGRRAWQGFLARCLAFEPAARPADSAAFADELSELLRSHPPTGRMGLRAGPGRLTRNVEILGRLQPGWVLEDRRL
jgi:hypothetical protein